MSYPLCWTRLPSVWRQNNNSRSSGGYMFFKFFNRNLKGYRVLVFIAILATLLGVGSDIFAAMPLKFIPSKISSSKADPACTYPFLNGVIDIFDPALNGVIDVFDPALRDGKPV